MIKGRTRGHRPGGIKPARAGREDKRVHLTGHRNSGGQGDPRRGHRLAPTLKTAGFTGNRRTASTLRQRPDISRRVGEIVRQRSDIAEKAQARAVERAIEKRALSVEYVIDTLMDNVEMCMARKTIPQKVFSKKTETVMQVDVTKHDPAGATAALALLGKHMGMFTEKAAVDVNVKVTRPDFTDPQAKLQLARRILFMIASAEHAVKNAPKTIEHN